MNKNMLNFISFYVSYNLQKILLIKIPLKRQWLYLCMNIEEKIKQFENEHFTSLRELNPVIKKNYQAIIRMLLEKEQMSKETLIRLAQRIKPLMYPKDESTLPHKLFWMKPVPLTESFYFNFDDDSVVKNSEGGILAVEGLEKVCEFICYHRYGGYYGFLRPGMDEIIQQFPAYLLTDEKAEYAIEMVFTSTNLDDIYDRILDRHVSTVIVYRIKNGLPQQLREQKVIYA